jgi:hypothetical protein
MQIGEAEMTVLTPAARIFGTKEASDEFWRLKWQ